ncbi:hypothetical protein HY844_01420 [Candidatus Berkelbacteria bacterium]|nr:hypothetical protein [Candidatus Berkelbacteria bacterium]
MNEQERLLEKEDGRYFAIDRSPTGSGTVSIATSEKMGNIISFGLPSSPALFLHLSYKAYSKIRNINPTDLFNYHPQGYWPDDHGQLFDFFENFIEHIVFAQTALEAFANEVIPFSFVFECKINGVKKMYVKDELERWVTLDEKLSTLLPKALNCSTIKGLTQWNKYKEIKDIRDRVIHLKMVDHQSSGSEVKTLWGVMLKNHAKPYCDYAHEIMGHYKPAVEKRRWYNLYPYETRSR